MRRRRCSRPPTCASGWSASPGSSEERHFPLYSAYLDFYWDEGDEPAFTWLRRGIPFELMGFGYDGIHEMWNRYRDGLSALALLARPPQDSYVEPDGIRVAWLESAAERIPQQTLLRIPGGRHTPRRPHRRRLRERRSRGRRRPGSGSGARRATSSSTRATTTGSTRGFSDPWDDNLIAEATGEWSGATALMDRVGRLSDWLEEDLPGRFAVMLDFVLGRLPIEGKEEQEHE